MKTLTNRDNFLLYYAGHGHIDEATNEGSWLPIITSGGVEPVADGGWEGHSVFAYYLIKKLTDNAQPYPDSATLFDRVKIAVTNNSYQRPLAVTVPLTARFSSVDPIPGLTGCGA